MWKYLFILSLVFATSLSAEKKVFAFAESQRAESVNKLLVTDAAKIARQLGAKVTVVDLKDYLSPIYDADSEAIEGMPVKARQIRKLMLESQVILIASPEYNGSLSALLKNTLDWASRNEQGEGSTEAFKGKTFAIMSASPGKGGGARGLVHLRTILENLGGVVVSQQVVIPEAYNAFDEKGELKSNEKQAELKRLIQTALAN